MTNQDNWSCRVSAKMRRCGQFSKQITSKVVYVENALLSIAPIRIITKGMDSSVR